MSIAPPLHKAVRKNQKATPPPVPEKPEGPAYTPPKPSPNVVQTAKAAVEKPKGLARMPRKPLPPLIRVENPRRLRKGSKEHRKLGGLVIASPAWGSPFRPREVDGQWFVAWIGDEMQLERFKPDGWEDIPCETRLEAAQLALEASRDWIASLHRPACRITPERSYEVTTLYVFALPIGPVMAMFCLSWRISDRFS